MIYNLVYQFCSKIIGVILIPHDVLPFMKLECLIHKLYRYYHIHKLYRYYFQFRDHIMQKRGEQVRNRLVFPRAFARYQSVQSHFVSLVKCACTGKDTTSWPRHGLWTTLEEGLLIHTLLWSFTFYIELEILQVVFLKQPLSYTHLHTERIFLGFNVNVILCTYKVSRALHKISRRIL